MLSVIFDLLGIDSNHGLIYCQQSTPGGFVRVDHVDLFYARLAAVTTDVDGSQDALIARVIMDDGTVGWGECEASPLTSIAAYIAPMSHGACRPVGDSLRGQEITSAHDIARIAAQVETNSLDLLQAPHTFSGVEIALWDALGKSLEVPVWSLIGSGRSHPKRPYASVLFGDTPEETLKRAREIAASGYTAGKFGWGPFGADLGSDRDHVMAAREGLGDDRLLMVDAGQAFEGRIDALEERLGVLADAQVHWIEEPFNPHSYGAYRSLRHNPRRRTAVAAGESSHSRQMAEALLDVGGVEFVQIDTGRIGGIGSAAAVAAAADRAGAQFVNHTFTSLLALSASLQPFAGLRASDLCEYPTSLSSLAKSFAHTTTHDLIGTERVSAPDAPGLGVDVDLGAISAELVDVDIIVNGEVLYTIPPIERTA